MNTPIIENTTITPFYNTNGVQTQWNVRANDGYLLHDNRYDFTYPDPETFEITPMLGYTRGMISVGVNYDFEANPFELYTVVDDGSMPENQIFGGGNNNHEVM